MHAGVIQGGGQDMRTANLLENFLRDARVGLRSLSRSPGFSILAILCLTLGIGANAAVFSWIEGLLFRPYPMVAHQERLLALSGTARGEPGATALSWPDYLDLQKSSTLLDTLFVSKITSATLNLGQHAETTVGSIVSANYFDAIEVHPILGRGFQPNEDVGSNSHPVVVISYTLWKNRFKSDPQIVGKTQRLNGIVHTIVGVAPQGFFGTFVGWAINFWVPASMEETFEGGGYKLQDRSARWVEAYVRLKPGVNRQQAQEEVSAISARLDNDYPDVNRGRSMRLWPLWQTPFNNAGTLLPTLETMVAVVVFVMLIACANVGNLLLVRSLSRRREMSIRAAVGAGSGRLFNQVLTESLILCALGAIGGLVVAHWCRHALILLFPSRGGATMYLPARMDWGVLAVIAGICLLATVLVGLVPAFQSGKVDLVSTLRAESTSVVGGGSKGWVRSSLVTVQVCLSFVLLVTGGLLVESLEKIRSADPGFLTHTVLNTAVPLAGGYDVEHVRVFQDELIDRVQALPGVESAAFARSTPMGYRGFSSAPITVDGYQPAPDEQPAIEYNEVGSGYLATMGIPLVSGREFTRADNETTTPVAVVNKTMALRYWRGQDPTGRRFQMRIQDKDQSLQVVGVAADSKYESMRETPRPFFYVPIRQTPVIAASLNIRTTLPRQTMATVLAREVRALDANLAPYEVISLQQQVDRSTSPQLVAVTLVAILGGLALLLATIGLYGVMSYSVSQSTRELGIRMALGANASGLLRLVLLRGLALTGGGVLLGAAAAFAFNRLLGNLLYNVSPYDPKAFGLAIAVMMSASLAACLLPSWRAARTNPASVLRD
jgi:predicted permease